MADRFNTRVNELFPTIVLIGDMPDCDPLNQALKEVIAQNRVQSGGIERSNTLGWHSTTDMMAWGGEAAQALGRRACILCDPYTVELSSPDERRFGWVAEMWANVSPPGASNQMHAHPGALWSVVYYVDTGYEGDGADQGGELVLHDPRFPMNRMYTPDIVAKRTDGKPEENVKGIRPRNGMIVAFPSWLKHSVRPYQGARERISIAINLMVGPGEPGR